MQLRPAKSSDLHYLLDLENKFRSLGFVGGDPPETHERQLYDPDCRYWIVEKGVQPAGYVILRGLASSNRSLELKRIVIAEPLQGLGRQVLQAIVDKAFQEFSAHRVWLDVFDDNARARHVYQSLGFIEEGIMRDCIYWGDRFRSLVLMSMLESEYQEASKNWRRSDHG